MRAYASVPPADQAPQAPDVVQTLLLAAGAPQSLDWPNSTGGAGASAVSVFAHLVRFTIVTTAMAEMLAMVNLVSTHAQVPTSGTSATTGTTAGSTGNSLPVLGDGTYQIPSWSTGWSAASPVPGYVIAEIWRK